jgi:hypothetical protein
MSAYVINPTTEQEKLMTAFLEEQHISFFKEDDDLPDYVLKGIAEGEADLEAGRTTTLEDFKKKLLMFK